MIIYFGTRNGGAVDGQAGQYAATRCFHLYFLPIIPLGSIWVTEHSGDGVRGVPIRLHLRSMAALYLRSWGLLATVLLLAGAGLDAHGLRNLAAGVLIGAAVSVSWLWRTRRRPRDIRAGELLCDALGAYCDPRYLPADRVLAMRQALESFWPRYAGQRSPNDVARLGPSSAQQAVLAYGILRLTACELEGAAGRDAARLADCILDESYEACSMPGGVYRRDGRDEGRGAERAGESVAL